MATFKLLEQYIGFAVREILIESKQNLMNIGFPEVIASLLIQKFGRNAFIVAKWLKDSWSYQFKGDYPKDWWQKANSRWGARDIDVVDAVRLYNAAQTSKEEYDRVRNELGFYVDPEDEFNPSDTLRMLKAEVAERLFDQIFFRYQLIEDIMSKELTNLKPYKDLSFQQAKDKYDEKRIFDDAQAVKEYDNGWKWINAGKKCQLVGGMMKNCGSTGVMSMDPDRTMIVLFDPNGKPHVVVTYSPNENRISGDEGQASTAVKSEYHELVLDLADHLDAKFDIERTKSKALKIKSVLRNKIDEMEEVKLQTSLSELYKIKLKNGEVYYSDGYYLVPEATMDKLADEEGSLHKAVNALSREGRSLSRNEALGIVRL